MKKFIKILLLLLFVSTTTIANVIHDAEVIFSHRGGIYDTCFNLTLNCTRPNLRIFYTTDGNIPTAKSQRYTDSIWLDSAMFSKSNICKIKITENPTAFFYPDSTQKAIVIRAAVFNWQDSCISDIATNTYFIDNSNKQIFQLPIIALTIDSTFLQNSNFEIFDKDKSYKQNVFIRNQKNSTFENIIVSPSIKNGKEKLEYEFFDNGIDNYQNLRLKSIEKSANKINDYVCRKIAKSLNFESANSKICSLYINGFYYGIYFIQEKIDKEYLSKKYYSNMDNLNIYKSHKCLKKIEKLISQFPKNDSIALANISQYIDINNFIDYTIFEIFINNKNQDRIKYWNEGRNEIRFTFSNGDNGFEKFDEPIYEYFNPENKNYSLFSKLAENKEFRNLFVERIKYLLAYELKYETTHNYIEEIKKEIGPLNKDSIISENIKQIDSFLLNRPTEINSLVTFLLQKDFKLRKAFIVFKIKTAMYFDEIRTLISTINQNLTPKSLIIYILLIISFIAFGIIIGRELKSWKIGVSLFFLLFVALHVILICAYLP